MKKIAVLLMTLILLCSIPMTVYADSVRIDTDVPASHSVMVDVTGGTVKADGVVCKDQIAVERQKSQLYELVPEKGYQLDKLYYNGQDVTSLVKDNQFVADPIHADGVLKVLFKRIAEKSTHPSEQSSGTTPGHTPETKKDTEIGTDGGQGYSESQSVKTGDTAAVDLGIWLIFLCLALAVIISQSKRKVVS
ncbi:MAG: hypothetical protein VZR73_17025 [Acutalibacteraceae bacterium]|nr:hypothetical protein [Clostridia bacterium]MEE3405784.1 hypothetical protein [Acutalibacteraceae bacterium]